MKRNLIGLEFIKRNRYGIYKKNIGCNIGEFSCCSCEVALFDEIQAIAKSQESSRFERKILYQKLYHIRNSGLNRPENLESMIEYARILAKPFPQVRVDF